MAVTSVLNQVAVQGTTKTVAVGLPTYTSLPSVEETVSPDGNILEGTFAYLLSGLPDTAGRVSWRIVYNPKTDTTRRTLRVSLIETRTTDALPSVLYPFSIDIAWSMVGRVMYDTAEVMTALELAFGALFKSVDTNGVPGTTVLDRLNNNMIRNLYV